jgi:effector-binding domain-containing protein
MTSPVIMEMGTDTKMSFVMPKEHTLESLPEPNSDNVELLTVSPKKYAVITFPGYANNKKISKYSKKLLKSVKSEGLETIGNINFMGYNAPWQVIGRKNEVAIEVK